MTLRKVWVKRPGASATLVTINEGDLVDDVRDMILRKYTNSLGRSYDPPDLMLRIVGRRTSMRVSPGAERILGPEEHLTRLLDIHYPGGQAVDEALIIDVPHRTPRASPRGASHVHFAEDARPGVGGEYFPPMPVAGSISSPHLPSAAGSVSSQTGHHYARTSTGLGPGHIPNLPSPGGGRTRGLHLGRPRVARTHTQSPTLLAGSPGIQVDAIAAPPALPQPHAISPAASTIPLGSPTLNDMHLAQKAMTRVAPVKAKTFKRGRKSGDHSLYPPGVLDGAVPPINVLIVEDNIINLRLLEAFMKRLKVRWQTAMNGREAVNKWRAGGYHLVLMDIQLPVMNGLDATKEIRRLERINSIGVFSSSSASSASSRAPTPPPRAPDEADDPATRREDDRLENIQLFKSPVIIVALTASSLQSDRHEALAAGCNDFLTKPVNYVWLERKVLEWGCMQALIDFDGWRRWKDFAVKPPLPPPPPPPRTIVPEESTKPAANYSIVSTFVTAATPSPHTTPLEDPINHVASSSGAGAGRSGNLVPSSLSSGMLAASLPSPDPHARSPLSPTAHGFPTGPTHGSSFSSSSTASSGSTITGPILSPSIPFTSSPSPPLSEDNERDPPGDRQHDRDRQRDQRRDRQHERERDVDRPNTNSRKKPARLSAGHLDSTAAAAAATSPLSSSSLSSSSSAKHSSSSHTLTHRHRNLHQQQQQQLHRLHASRATTTAPVNVDGRASPRLSGGSAESSASASASASASGGNGGGSGGGSGGGGKHAVVAGA